MHGAHLRMVNRSHTPVRCLAIWRNPQTPHLTGMQALTGAACCCGLLMPLLLAAVVLCQLLRSHCKLALALPEAAGAPMQEGSDRDLL